MEEVTEVVKKTKNPSAKTLAAKAEKLRKQAEEAAAKAAILAQEAAEKSKLKAEKPVRVRALKQPEAADAEALSKVVNYGQGTKDKNLINMDSLVLRLRNEVPEITSNIQGRDIVRGFWDAISKAILDGYGIPCTGNTYSIGVIHIRPLKAVKRRNLKTGKEIEVEKKVTVRLRTRKKSSDKIIALREELTNRYSNLINEAE